MNGVDVMRISAIKQYNWENWMKEMGHETCSTFFGDLSIAEMISGKDGIRDTFNRVKKEYSNDTKMFTEFIMCLNHKSWEHSETSRELAIFYDELWQSCCDFVNENWNDEQLSYYYQETD